MRQTFAMGNNGNWDGRHESMDDLIPDVTARRGHRNIQHAYIATGEATEQGHDQHASLDVQTCQEARRRG